MAEKVKLTVSPAVAAFVRPGTPVDVRRTGCAAAADLPAADRLMLLLCLSKDADPDIRSDSCAQLKDIPETVIREYLELPGSHPLLLKMLPLMCSNYPRPVSCDETDESPPDDDVDENSDPDAPDEPVNEEGEEYLSKYKLAQQMGIAEKIKMALTGDKEWRSILVKDANRLVSSGVIKNPRISEAEVLTLVKSGIQNDEIIRLICANKEWIKNYRIRRALVENSRTPVQNAVRYLGTMGEKDLAALAKSRNISSVVSTAAKRLLLNKKK